MNRPLHLLRSGTTWKLALLELFVVAAGLLLGFQLDRWWEGRNERVLEREYLADLREDFAANERSLDELIVRLEQIATGMVTLVEQSSSAPTLSVEELNRAFAQVQEMPTYTPVRRAYDNLTGSGELRLIRDRDLKNALADYYARAAVTEVVQATHELELVHTFQPYILDHLDYVAVHLSRVEDFPLPPATEPERILEVLETRGFRNVVTQKWTITTDLLDQHRSLRERTAAITELLESATDR